MAEYASNSKGNLGVALGAVGTGLGILGSGAGLLGLMPNQAQSQQQSGGGYVTKEMLDLSMKLAAKDSELALVKSEQNTEVKIADVYERIMTKVNANQREQDAINREQAVYNGVNNATINCMKGHIEQLLSLTALRIPNTSVCPGWGPVNVSPASTGTTTA